MVNRALMKKVLLLLVCVMCIFACQKKEEGFTINGSLIGDAEGGRVFLQDTYVYPPVNLDSTIVKDGKFTLKGKVDAPAMYSLIIDINEPGAEEPDGRNKMFKINFYLENNNITFEGDVATLPSYYWNPDRKGVPVIKGSATQDLYQKFFDNTRNLDEKLTELNTQYSKEYIIPEMEGQDATARGIEIVKAEKPLKEQKRKIDMQFIKDNISSIVAFNELFTYAAYFGDSFTAAELDEMVALAEAPWAGTKQLEQLKAAVAKSKKIAKGEKYIDGEFLNQKGEKVMLSSLIPKDKYVMLEFWASWCGPCRGEIPHLVKVNKKYKDFDIISISVDDKDADWQKAMKEEGMIWKQLRNPNGLKGIVQDEYNITGVPTCIILDKEGRFFKTNMRGAYLDEFLLDTYGE